MKINELLLESPQDIKLMITMMGFDIDQLSELSQKVRAKHQESITQKSTIPMKTYLFQINMKFVEISQLKQWQEWGKTSDGISLQRELDKLYSDNLTYMSQYN
jgi:hypothetical protein